MQLRQVTLPTLMRHSSFVGFASEMVDETNSANNKV